MKVEFIGDFEKYLLADFKKNYKGIVKKIKDKLALDDSLIKELKSSLETIKKNFLAGLEK